MRINKFVAQATGMSRRAADQVIAAGRVLVNNTEPSAGLTVQEGDSVTLDGKQLTRSSQTTTILLNKPVGYVVSRNGQGSDTIYDLLPKALHQLKPIGRLDKDSSGLLLLTNDGELANQLTHPRYQKEKVYQVVLDRELSATDKALIEQGVELADGLSALQLQGSGTTWTVTMSEGRNRQIRRTFQNLNYDVLVLHRIRFGSFKLDKLAEGQYLSIPKQ